MLELIESIDFSKSRKVGFACIVENSFTPYKYSAFSLAGILAAIVIIGIVALLLCPPVYNNISERSNSNKEVNVALKITSAMEQMQVLGLLAVPYKSTEEFADELQKYLNVTKRCNPSNISDCWPSDTVTTSDNTVYEVKNAKSGMDLGLANSMGNVGFVFPDGTSVILNYNPKPEGINILETVRQEYKNLPVGNGKTKRFAYSSSVAKDIDFVTDVNGAKGPNSEPIDGKYNDVRSFRNARFTKTAN